MTLGRRLRDLAPGLTARAVLEKFAAMQMLDVRIPTSDGREVLLTRYTQPEPELQLLLAQTQTGVASATTTQDLRSRPWTPAK